MRKFKVIPLEYIVIEKSENEENVDISMKKNEPKNDKIALLLDTISTAKMEMNKI